MRESGGTGPARADSTSRRCRRSRPTAHAARRLLRCLLVVLWLGPALAAPGVSVVALFQDKAMIEIDGRRQLLAVGQTTPEGVRLLAASAKEAVLEIDGRRHTVGLSRRIGGSYATPGQRQVHISRDRRGMYTTTGSVNGMAMSFLVDTGATTVALNAGDAARAGVDFRLRGVRVAVNTASGTAIGYQVTLDRVSVGDISVAGVQAIVLDGGSPTMPLLGMSFLGHLKMRHEGHLLVLEQPR